jgi:hypothetical protein
MSIHITLGERKLDYAAINDLNEEKLYHPKRVEFRSDEMGPSSTNSRYFLLANSPHPLGFQFGYRSLSGRFPGSGFSLFACFPYWSIFLVAMLLGLGGCFVG